METYGVALTPDERYTWEKSVSVGKAAARKLPHARILLLADTSHELAYRDDQIGLASGPSLRSVERIRKRFVPEGLDTALNPKPQPPRPEKINIKGAIEQPLVHGASQTRPGTMPLDFTTAGRRTGRSSGLVDAVGIETVRHAVEKNDIQPGIVNTWCIPPHADADFVWRLEDGLHIFQAPSDPRYPVVCSVSTKPVSNCLGTCGHPNRLGQAHQRGWSMSMSGKACAISSSCVNPCVAGGTGTARHDAPARITLAVYEPWWKTISQRRLCTKSRSFIGFLGVKIGLSGLEKAFKMRLKRSY